MFRGLGLSAPSPWKWGWGAGRQSCWGEPLICGIWCYLWVVRISWMIRHPNGGRQSLVSVGKTCYPPSHIGIGCRIIWHMFAAEEFYQPASYQWNLGLQQSPLILSHLYFQSKLTVFFLEQFSQELCGLPLIFPEFTPLDRSCTHRTLWKSPFLPWSSAEMAEGQCLWIS